MPYYLDVFLPAVLELEAPEFWLVVPSIELPEVNSAEQLVEIAASFGERESGGIRWGWWLSRQDGRHHPIVSGNWLGDVSVAVGSAVSFRHIGAGVLSVQTPPQLVFPMLLAVGRGAEFHPELLERRWLRLSRVHEIKGIPKLDVIPMSDLSFAWSYYHDWWSQIWFEGKAPMDLARLLLAWHRQELRVRTPLGALHGQVGKRREQAREERRLDPDEWKRECQIEELGQATEEGVRQVIRELNEKVREHEYRISALELSQHFDRKTHKAAAR